MYRIQGIAKDYFMSNKITINMAINTARIHVDPKMTAPLLAGN